MRGIGRSHGFVLGLLLLVLAGTAPVGCDDGSGSGHRAEGEGATAEGEGAAQASKECEDFCASVVSACPEEDDLQSCLRSCALTDRAPDDSDQDCADDARDCAAVRTCWSALYE